MNPIVQNLEAYLEGTELASDQTGRRLRILTPRHRKLSSKMSSETTTRFWAWFAENIHDLEEPLQPEVVERLEIEIARVAPGAGWEIGPGFSAGRFFALSPGRDARLRASIKAVVAAAPEIEGWELHAARPPRRWQYRFRMRDAAGGWIKVNAADWRYSLVAYDQRRFFDVSLYADLSDSLDEKMRRQVAWIVAEGALGEEMVLDRVGAVSLLDASSAPGISATGRIDHLRQHLLQLVGSAAAEARPRPIDAEGSG